MKFMQFAKARSRPLLHRDKRNAGATKTVDPLRRFSQELWNCTFSSCRFIRPGKSPDEPPILLVQGLPVPKYS